MQNLSEKKNKEHFYTLVAAIQRTRRKKKAAVPFTTIPCEPNAANRYIDGHIFGVKSVLVVATLCMARLKFLELFCAFFMKSSKDL